MAMNRSAASAIGSVATLMWAFSGLAWAVTEVFDEFDDLDEVEPPEELQATAARMVAAATAPSRRRGGRANVTDASWPPGGQVRIGNPGQAIQRGEFFGGLARIARFRFYFRQRRERRLPKHCRVIYGMVASGEAGTPP